MRLSIAMCTHNGETYISQQLDSIVRQVRRPDELVICDDTSTDDTVPALERFAASAPFTVRIHLNRERLGSTANFQKAIELCEGDVIALSDQDDIWLENRLSVTEAAFDADPKSLLFFSNASLVDESGKSLGITLSDSLRFGSSERAAFKSGEGFEVLLRRNFVTGATMAFRSELRGLLFPIPEIWVHDAWIALLCCFLGEVKFDNSPLILYRQHSRQQIGAAKQTLEAGLQKARSRTRAFYAGELARFDCLRQRISSHSREPLQREKIERLERKLKFSNERLHCATAGHWSIPKIALNYLRMRYERYANGWRGAGTDLMAVLNRRSQEPEK